MYLKSPWQVRRYLRSLNIPLEFTVVSIPSHSASECSSEGKVFDHANTSGLSFPSSIMSKIEFIMNYYHA